MKTEAYEYETQRIDHLGIVAGVCKRIGLIEWIDGALPSPVNRQVSCGQAVQAMVLNALGLTGRALYLMPEYMKGKPVDILIGEGLKAEDFNDDTLGRALDEVQQMGVTELFADIAAEALRIYEIEPTYAHVDSSSFSVKGKYDSEYAQNMAKRYEAVNLKRGYSKEKRPDLKQVVVNLITSQASAIPMWLEVLDGNQSDKEGFQKTVTSYGQQLSDEKVPPWFIMDSAGYTRDNIQTWGEIKWVTRVPETSKLAKTIIQSVPTQGMTPVENGYRIHALCTWYGGIRQRWLLVHSEKADEREQKQLDKRLAKKRETYRKKWRHLCAQSFQCQADAADALAHFQQSLTWWTTKAQIVPIRRHARPGRPAKGARGRIVAWSIQGTLTLDETAVAQHRQWLGRFIIATNILDEQALSDPQILACYKEQATSVERGFRFLRDPMFFADSLFLKSPVRIMAMIMIMGLALLIYALAERELRTALTAQNETLPHQTGKPTQNITMRRVAQILEGIALLLIKVGSQIVERRIINLTPVRLKILRLFNPHVQNCYLLHF